jgi:SAM-dependent MidA family methyltransferase
MSKALTEQIGRKIGERGGWLPFDEFMREALYAPQLGYYESGQVFGAEGDFVTGTEVGPWLALGFADLLEWGWTQLGAPDDWALIEQGGGEGRLLCDVLGMLKAREMRMPASVYAIERSAQLSQRQAQAYAALGVDVILLECLDGVPVSENVLYFCNELPDAFPVKCFVRRDGVMLERGVALGGQGEFVWQERQSDVLPRIDEKFVVAWPDGYISEWNPYLAGWQADISRIMQRGFVFTVDYGYAQSEYYRPQRIEGSLLAHLKHEVEHDVLSDPGSRDITAHVDFTALARAGRKAGLEMSCWIAQGAWLAQSPAVQAFIQQAVMQPSEKSTAVMAQAKRMLLPQGMGDLFKLSVQSKGVASTSPDYLASFNRVDALGIGDA